MKKSLNIGKSLTGRKYDTLFFTFLKRNMILMYVSRKNLLKMKNWKIALKAICPFLQNIFFHFFFQFWSQNAWKFSSEEIRPNEKKIPKIFDFFDFIDPCVRLDDRIINRKSWKICRGGASFFAGVKFSVVIFKKSL